MRRGKGNKAKKIPKNKSFFNDKRLLAISIAAFFIFVFLLAFVNVSQSNVGSTGKVVDGETSKGFIQKMFTDWSEGNIDTNIAKYLIFFMLLFLIFGILNFARFPPNGFLQFLIALPIAFLSTAYLIPGEILTILQGYETLGIVLSFILPFVILIFFSAMLLSNEKIRRMSVSKIMLEVFLWLFFIVVLAYKIISGLARKEIPLGLNLPIIIMGAVFLISLFIFVFNKPFRTWVWNIGNELRQTKSKAERTEAGEAIRTEKEVERAREER